MKTNPPTTRRGRSRGAGPGAPARTRARRREVRGRTPRDETPPRPPPARATPGQSSRVHYGAHPDFLMTSTNWFDVSVPRLLQDMLAQFAELLDLAHRIKAILLLQLLVAGEEQGLQPLAVGLIEQAAIELRAQLRMLLSSLCRVGRSSRGKLCHDTHCVMMQRACRLRPPVTLPNR